MSLSDLNCRGFFDDILVFNFTDVIIKLYKLIYWNVLGLGIIAPLINISRAQHLLAVDDTLEKVSYRLWYQQENKTEESKYD